MDKMNFVITTDEETKDLLIKEGFQLIDSQNNKWTFMNNAVMTFDSEKKCAFTNKLCV